MACPSVLPRRQERKSRFTGNNLRLNGCPRFNDCANNAKIVAARYGAAVSKYPKKPFTYYFIIHQVVDPRVHAPKGEGQRGESFLGTNQPTSYLANRW